LIAHAVPRVFIGGLIVFKLATRVQVGGENDPAVCLDIRAKAALQGVAPAGAVVAIIVDPVKGDVELLERA